MKPMKYLIVFGILLALFTACGEGLYYCILCNNSDRDVGIVVSWSGSLANIDTILPIKEKYIDILEKRECAGNIRISPDQDITHVFILDPDTVESYSWDELRAGSKYLKRYDFTWKDTDRLNNQVSYPPTDNMRDVKMYPPYGSEGE